MSATNEALRPRLAPRAALLAVAVLAAPGCAVRYYDARSGTEHLWGFGHLKVRVASPAGEARPAFATQTELLGAGASFGSDGPGGGLHLGWDRRTRVFVPDDTALSLEWPGPQLFDVRVGSAEAPFLPSSRSRASASSASP